MPKLFLFLLLGFSSMSYAQTPANNLMPDGSRDTYIGLGVVASPRYEGADETRVALQPVLQVQWSNGLFLAGSSAGLHLSARPDVEYGPLLALEGRRTVSGTHAAIGYLFSGADNASSINTVVQQANGNKLQGMDEIHPRLLLGGFYHVQLGSALRLTNRVLAGYGNDHQGMRWNADLWQQFDLGIAHHNVSIGLGGSLVNQAYNQTYFGVTKAESLRNHLPGFTPSAGVKDVHLALHWNWSLNSSVLLTTGINLSHLTGDAAASPLVERKTNLTAASALAYRF
jgi:outer membrane protein